MKKRFSKDNMEEINRYLNDFFVYFKDDRYFNDHLAFFMDLTDALSKIFKDIPDEINLAELTRKLPFYSIEDRINIVKKYLKDHGFNDDVDDLINRGQIIPNNNSYATDVFSVHSKDPYLGGVSSKYPNDIPYIKVPNTGYIFDSLVMAHELSHLRNTGKKETYVRYYLTETIAYTEELLLLNDLKESHKEEMNVYILMIFIIFKRLVMRYRLIFPFLYTYSACGDISLESVKLSKAKIYNYDRELYEFIYSINRYDIYLLKNELGYLLVLLLSFYLLSKNDISMIKDLRDNLNNITEFDDFYKKIGLKRLDINELLPFLKNYIDENVLPVISLLEEKKRLKF